MALPADALYEQVLELAKRLPLDRQQELVQELKQTGLPRNPDNLSAEEKIALLDSIKVSVGAVLPGYSDRREDWYGDDGR